MNKIIFTICTLCMMFCTSCISSSQVNYNIKGTVHGMDGEMIYLRTEEGERTLIDSTIISNSSFTFKGTQPEICFASVCVGENNKGATIVLENGTININISFDKPTRIAGTPTNDLIDACNRKIYINYNDFKVLIKRQYELTENQKDESAVLQNKIEELYDKQTAIIKECINQNLNNIVGAYLLHQYKIRFSNKEIAKILDNASPVMKENGFAKELIEYQEALMRSKIGGKFTDFKLKDPNDKEVSLSDYIGKGKYVLIDFWASWCGPCRKEMPNVKAAYEKFKSKGFEIVGVSLDFKKEDWLKGIQDLCITWPQMSDLKGWKCEGAKIYGVTGIPSTLLIDPDGIIIAKNLMGEDLEKKLSELLK